MKIIIEGNAKEIAALALELQGRRSRETIDGVPESIIRHIGEGDKVNSPIGWWG